MKKIYDSIIGSLVFLLYAGAICLYLAGTVHAFNKHGVGDGMIGMVLFPWNVYRGVEMFWHNDYAGVDWDKKLKHDMENAVGILNSLTDKHKTISEYQLGKDVDDFASSISNYPQDKINFLKDGVSQYAKLQINSLNEMKDLMAEMAVDKRPPFRFSDNTAKLEKLFSEKYGLPDIQTTMDSVIVTLKNICDTASSESLLRGKDAMESSIEYYKGVYLNYYPKIFNTKLSL